MPEPLEIDLPFRGDRGYVHSASLCNWFAARFPGWDRFEIVMKALMASRVLLREVESPRPGFGHARIVRGGAVATWELSEDAAHPVTERVPSKHCG